MEKEGFSDDGGARRVVWLDRLINDRHTCQRLALMARGVLFSGKASIRRQIRERCSC